MSAQERVGQTIRATHPYGFRCGTWGTVAAVLEDPENGREMYVVTFEDGVTDFWVVSDPLDHYEFQPPAEDTRRQAKP